MAKKKLAEDMSDITVDELRREHRSLIARRMTGPGDSEAAMHRLDQEHGLPYWSQWNFQYKRERKPSPEFLTRLQQVILCVLRKSVRTDLAKLENKAAMGDVAPDLADLKAEAESVLAKIQERLSA